jgi:trigger factor
MEDFRAGLVPVAKVRVKSNLVIEAIAKAEKVEATDEDVDAKTEKMAAQYNMKKE